MTSCAGDGKPHETTDPTAGGEPECLLPLVYDELHRLAVRFFRSEPPGHTLQPTALVNEAYLRLSSQEGHRWQSRNHFTCVAAKAMRQILVNHARRRGALKRGGGRRRVSLEGAEEGGAASDLDLEALDEALEELAAYDPRKSQIVELRYFVGLTIEETAEALEISPATVKRDWILARAWLHRRIVGDPDGG
ncbi:MAG: sigma-70 family RNA polymerase sigma factor [Planctomycetota bacterium]